MVDSVVKSCKYMIIVQNMHLKDTNGWKRENINSGAYSCTDSQLET